MGKINPPLVPGMKSDLDSQRIVVTIIMFFAVTAVTAVTPYSHKALRCNRTKKQAVTAVTKTVTACEYGENQTG